MSTLFTRKCMLGFAGLLLWNLGLCSVGRSADDEKGTGAAATPAAKASTETKADSGLTERERWLLERVEQLEKRVEELEVKEHAGSLAATPASSNAAMEGGPIAPSSTSVTAATKE